MVVRLGRSSRIEMAVRWEGRLRSWDVGADLMPIPFWALGRRKTPVTRLVSTFPLAHTATNERRSVNCFEFRRFSVDNFFCMTHTWNDCGHWRSPHRHAFDL